MLGSVVLDVAIGMSFVYLLLSLIASVVQEIISTFLQLRSANLERGIRSLVSGDSIWGKDLVDAIYDHGLVRGLYSDPQKDSGKSTGKWKLLGNFHSEGASIPHRDSAGQTGYRGERSDAPACVYPGADLCAGRDRHPQSETRQPATRR